MRASSPPPSLADGAATPAAPRAPAASAPGSAAFVARGALACALGYLYGSLPVVYLLGRRQRLDLRAIGSGNVGATNLLASAGPAVSVGGWLFDASKGIAPYALARGMGCSPGQAALAAVCGAAGQCWPIFLRFRGGRGISAFVGAALVLSDPATWALTLLPLIGGGLWRVPGTLKRRRDALATTRPTRTKSVPLGCFIGVALFPLLCASRAPAGERRSAVVASSLLSAVVVIRRLTASLPDDARAGPRQRPAALWYRLLYDRNTSD